MLFYFQLEEKLTEEQEMGKLRYALLHDLGINKHSFLSSSIIIMKAIAKAVVSNCNKSRKRNEGAALVNQGTKQTKKCMCVYY